MLGPRQVGKTTLALSLTREADNSPLYLDLELSSDSAKLADPELYLSDYEDRLVILDEIHRLPGIFQTLRGLIDRRKRKGKRTGQFLLLGSASIDLLQQSAETLAGRIAYRELTPFLESDVVGSPSNVNQALWVRGGFPDSFLAESETQSYEWRAAFIQTYLERDVPSLGPRIPAETLFDRSRDCFGIGSVRLSHDGLSTAEFNCFDYGRGRAGVLRIRDSYSVEAVHKSQ